MFVVHQPIDPGFACGGLCRSPEPQSVIVPTHVPIQLGSIIFRGRAKIGGRRRIVLAAVQNRTFPFERFFSLLPIDFHVGNGLFAFGIRPGFF